MNVMKGRLVGSVRWVVRLVTVGSRLLKWQTLWLVRRDNHNIDNNNSNRDQVTLTVG